MYLTIICFFQYNLMCKRCKMKKRILMTLVISALLLVPIIVRAEVKVLDLRDTLEEKEITIADNNYKENDEQIKIYLFRWASCSHCYDFLVYLNSLVPEYGHMFKLRSYETTTNQDNNAVMEKVKKYFGDGDKGGVPYIVIGKETFYGFGESSKNKIVDAIKSLYESKDRFDVFDALEEKESKKNPNDGLYIIIPIGLIIIVAVVVKLVKGKAE